jgi:hypothetical protein
MEFTTHRTIGSLQMYVLIAQDQPLAEVHRRQPDGKWVIEDIQGLEASISLPGIGVELPMAEVFYRVDFTEVEPDGVVRSP